jgi:hypothetical protein
LPKVTGHGLEEEENWLAKLVPDLEEADVVGVCPVDPEADHRLENRLTSYLLDGFCARIEEEHDEAEGEHEHEHKYKYEYEDHALAGTPTSIA